jgi:rhamnogalacturonan endolyase
LVYPAESATLAGGTAIANRFNGYHGTGYITFPNSGGTATFTNINGNGGGAKNLAIRYSLGGGTGSRTGTISVNGVSKNITFTPTFGSSNWANLTVTITLNNNSTNIIVLTSTGSGLANIDEITVP